MSDLPFSVLSVCDTDVETRVIDRKDVRYCRDNLRCIFLLTDRERSNTYLARGLQIYPVSITAQTPPTAPDNTFSDYTGKLYLQGQKAIDAYYDAFTCWDRFSSYVMIEPTEMKYDGVKKIEGKPGDTFQLKATLMPENVTLPQVFWRSTNPEIATVDENGLVTIHADLEEVMFADSDNGAGDTCKIIAESLYANGPVVEVEVTGQSGVDDILVDESADGIEYGEPYDVYNLSGVWVGDSLKGLSHGFYIVRQGKVVKKIAIK